jgi:hypothetical protein
MTRRFAVGAALVCALLVPSAAHAGTPFTIGEGNDPSVYTQPDTGTAHVVWQNESSSGYTYCAIPRGATACASPKNLGTFTGSSVGTAYILRDTGNTLRIVAGEGITGTVHVITSLDLGANWGAWTKLYGGPGMPNMREALQPFIRGTEVVMPSFGSFVLSTPLNGTENAFNANADFDNGNPGDTGAMSYDTAAAPTPDGRVVLVGNDLATATFRLLNAPASDVNLEGSWGPATGIAGPLDTTHLAAGSTGTYLFGSGAGVGGGVPEIRKWNGAGFDAPVTLDNDTAYINDVTVGPTGLVAAIWRRNDPGAAGNRLKMATSGTGEPGSFTTATIGREDAIMGGMNVSLAGDNAGWVTYEGQGSGATSRIRLVDTSVVPDPPVPPATTPVTPAPTPAKPLPKPVTPKKTTKTASVTSNGATISLGVPNTCIPSGKPFIATLSWKKQKRKGNKFVKITRTDFYIGSKRLKIDKKAPFRQTLRIPSPKKGQTYKLKARAYIKVKKTKRVPKKSVTTTLKVCS